MSAPVIRVRLTLLYAGTIAALLLGSTTVLYEVVTHTLEREFEHSVEESLGVMQRVFRAEIMEYRTVEMTLAHVASEIAFPDREVEFVRPNGAVFAVGGMLGSESAQSVGPLRTRETSLDPKLAPGWRVRLRASDAELHLMQQQLNRWFLIAVPAITLLALAAGWWVTGRTLRPVGTMATAAERIDANAVGIRLPVANPDDELGRLGIRFNALLDRLEQTIAQQRRFLADAEHELRTPITRMRHQVDLALQDESGHSHGPALEAIGRDIARASTMLAELLLLARVDSGAAEGRRERRFLDDLVLDALGPWRAVAADAGVGLATTRVEEAPALVEPGLIERLVGILVDNAIRYTPRDGRVDVRTFVDGDSAVLEIQDTGIGIAAEERERIFERFYRGAAARAAAPEGSGLGLSIAQWIVARHEGTIALRPAGESGTLARVEIPRSS